MRAISAEYILPCERFDKPEVSENRQPTVAALFRLAMIRYLVMWGVES
jgi:hypothetical protein